MKPVTYTIDVYEPGSHDELWMTFTAATPFMNIHVNEIINASPWLLPRRTIMLLRVTAVEHELNESDSEITHKIVVFTREQEYEED